MANPHAPYHPIIYVRGFAGTQGEIEDTVGDPYMGFNIGSTKSRQVWDGKMRRYYFESPLVRLKDEPIWTRLRRRPAAQQRPLRRCLCQRRGPDGAASRRPDPAAALRHHPAVPVDRHPALLRRRLGRLRRRRGASDRGVRQGASSDLILRMRTLVCRKGGKNPMRPDEMLDNGVAEADFKVYLVAHSMGGLVCRAFLQNEKLGDAQARAAVDKLFTYATPHNGIDLRMVRNVPGWSALGEATNFNRERMAGYLGLPEEDRGRVGGGRLSRRSGSSIWSAPTRRTTWSPRVSRRGRSARRATAWCAWTTPPLSAGSATRRSSRRAPTSIAATRASTASSTRKRASRISPASCSARSAPTAGSTSSTSSCPTRCRQAYDRDNDSVRASYRFEIVAALRASQWQLHRRVVRENSAIQPHLRRAVPEGTPHGKRGAEPGRAARTCSRSSSIRTRARSESPERRVRLRRGDPRSRLPDRRRALAEEAISRAATW